MINNELSIKQYTYHYESQHYSISDWSLFNNTITITDHYNNSITYNSSLILSINSDITLHYHIDDHFNEIHKTNPFITPTTKAIPNGRRRLKSNHQHHGQSHKWTTHQHLHHHNKNAHQHHSTQSALSRWLQHWKSKTHHHHMMHKHPIYGKNRYAEQGRFVGYFKQRKRGSTFSEANKWCSRKYGGIASIGNQHENEQVKRVCRVILGNTKKNGFYCWLGLRAPFSKWIDNRQVTFQKWATHQKHMNNKDEYVGSDRCVGLYKKTGYWYHQRCNYRNGVVCSKPRGIYVGNYIVIQKQYRYEHASKMCQEWYGTHLATISNDAHNRDVRRACQRVSDTGHCWIGLQAPFKIWDDGINVKYTNWAPGEPNNQKTEGCTEIYPSSRWNNLPCRVHRYPVCNGKPLVERIDPELRKRLVAEQFKNFRQDWLRHQRQRWMAKQKEKRGWEYNYRKMMMRNLKMRVHQRYRDDLATKFFNAQFQNQRSKQLGYQPLLSKPMLMQMYHMKYGKFPKVQNPKWMRDYMKMLMMRDYQNMLRMRRGNQMRMQQRMSVNGMRRNGDYQINNLLLHKRTYGDLDHDPNGQIGTGVLDGMNRDLKMRLQKPYVPYVPQNGRRFLLEDDDRKCVLLGNIDGLHEVCIGADYVDIKRYVRRVMKSKAVNEVVDFEYDGNMISNSSEVAVDWIDFENWKYRKCALIDEHQSMSLGYKYSLIENVEDEVYYAERYEFVIDFGMNEEECWSLMDDVVILCLVIHGEDSVGFKVSKQRRDSNEFVYGLNGNAHWDEVNVYLGDDMVEKCTHFYDMKVCINVVENEETNQLEIVQMNVLTLHEDEHRDEIFF